MDKTPKPASDTPLIDMSIHDLVDLSMEKGGRGLWSAKGPKYTLLVSLSIVEDDAVAAGLSSLLGNLLGAYGDLDDLASAVADGSLVTSDSDEAMKTTLLDDLVGDEATLQ